MQRLKLFYSLGTRITSVYPDNYNYSAEKYGSSNQGLDLTSQLSCGGFFDFDITSCKFTRLPKCKAKLNWQFVHERYKHEVFNEDTTVKSFLFISLSLHTTHNRHVECICIAGSVSAWHGMAIQYCQTYKYVTT